MTRYYTDAPEDYDYWYVTTIAPANIGGWRVIEVTDDLRFEGFQLPRYNSGLHAAFKMGSDAAKAVGLEGGEA